MAKKTGETSGTTREEEEHVAIAISSELNGTSTSNNASYAITSQPSTNLGNLQNQVNNGKLDMLLVRIALGTVVWWEIVLTIALMLATIFICALFSVRVYRLGVLMYGQRPGLGQLMKMVWMK